MKQYIDTLEDAISLKWKWAGHIARLHDKRWPQVVTEWEGPPEIRRRNRPRACWGDDILKVAGHT